MGYGYNEGIPQQESIGVGDVAMGIMNPVNWYKYNPGMWSARHGQVKVPFLSGNNIRGAANFFRKWGGSWGNSFVDFVKSKSNLSSVKGLMNAESVWVGSAPMGSSDVFSVRTPGAAGLWEQQRARSGGIFGKADRFFRNIARAWKRGTSTPASTVTQTGPKIAGLLPNYGPTIPMGTNFPALPYYPGSSYTPGLTNIAPNALGFADNVATPPFRAPNLGPQTPPTLGPWRAPLMNDPTYTGPRMGPQLVNPNNTALVPYSPPGSAPTAPTTSSRAAALGRWEHMRKWSGRTGVKIGRGLNKALRFGGKLAMRGLTTMGKGFAYYELARLGYSAMEMMFEPLGRSAIGTVDAIFNARAQMGLPELGGNLSMEYLTRGAATERQRAVQAISKSRLNARSGLGGEAALMHM